ncbi:unnamed protein product [Prorocentrum cordatum]|uniref:Uncharacterized protein n=1 Tax=Prorocentrum cordatum TaxID=2364126 RepID=A0ABN9WPW3_9DINO|nr:unnamed protein product [Polarella glacialis]
MLTELWNGPPGVERPPRASASKGQKRATRRLRLTTCRQAALDWACLQQPDWWSSPWTNIYAEEPWQPAVMCEKGREACVREGLAATATVEEAKLEPTIANHFPSLLAATAGSEKKDREKAGEAKIEPDATSYSSEIGACEMRREARVREEGRSAAATVAEAKLEPNITGHSPSSLVATAGAAKAKLEPNIAGHSPLQWSWPWSALLACVQREKAREADTSSNSIAVVCKKGRKNYCFAMRHTLREQRFKAKFEDGAEEKVEKAVQDALDWLAKNQLAEQDGFESKRKELEGIVNPLVQQPLV